MESGTFGQPESPGALEPRPAGEAPTGLSSSTSQVHVVHCTDTDTASWDRHVTLKSFEISGVMRVASCVVFFVSLFNFSWLVGACQYGFTSHVTAAPARLHSVAAASRN